MKIEKRFLNYVKASSPQGLVESIKRLQNKRQMEFNFHSVQYVNGSWYAFYNDIEIIQINQAPIKNETVNS